MCFALQSIEHEAAWFLKCPKRSFKTTEDIPNFEIILVNKNTADMDAKKVKTEYTKVSQYTIILSKHICYQQHQQPQRLDALVH